MTDDQKNFSVIVDGLSAPLAHAVAKVVETLTNFEEVKPISKDDQRKDVLNNLLQQNSDISLIIQQVDDSKWPQYRKNSFTLPPPQPGKHFGTSTDTNNENKDPMAYGERTGHPLCYRLTIEEMKEWLDNNKNKQSADLGQSYAAFSVPIIYIGASSLEQDSVSNSADGRDRLFLDSSIWHRFVPTLPTQGDCSKHSYFVTQLIKRINQVKNWWEKGLYQKIVSLEHLDNSIRKLRYYRLPELGRHYQTVSLHGFHSETIPLDIDRKTTPNCETTANGSKKDTDSFQHIEQSGSPGYEELRKCRFLLIDDYAMNDLSKTANSSGPFLSKANLLRDILAIPEIDNSEGSFPCPPNEARQRDYCTQCGNIHCATSISAAQELLGREPGEDQKGGMYDIILLDYNLGRNKSRDSEKQDSETGTDFIRDIAEDSDEQQSMFTNQGPGGKFWIFTFSAFPEAFTADMIKGMFQPFSHNYYIFSGADPVCTPQLFKQKLQDLVRTQMKELSLAPEITTFKESKLARHPKHPPDIARCAAKLHSDLIRKYSVFSRLEEDKGRGSEIAKWVRQSSNSKNLAPLYEHMISLLYYVAYGTEMDWPRMLDEWRYVQQFIYQTSFDDKETTAEIKDIRQSLESILGNLRHHIDHLAARVQR